MRSCSKPACRRPGAVVLAYDYPSRVALLHDPSDGDMSPHLYPLCASCAEALRPPIGWELVDRRSKPVLFVGEPARAEPPSLLGRRAG